MTDIKKALMIMTLVLFPLCSLDAEEPAKVITSHEGMKLITQAVPQNFEVSNPAILDFEGKTTKMGWPFLAYSLYNGIYGHSMGAYAVNPWTGDVWDLWRCKPIDNPSLTKSRLKIRKRANYSDAEYATLHQKQPLCLEEPGVIP